MHHEIDLLTFALNQCDEIIIATDSHTRIIYVNQRAIEFLGYTQNELLTMCIAQIAPHLKEEVLLQLPLSNHDHQEPSAVNMFYQSKNKHSFPVSVKILPCLLSEFYLLFMAKDQSTNTQLYDLLIHSENEFIAFIENSNDIIIRYDVDFKCIYVNATFEKITGYSRLGVVEKHYWQTGILSPNQIQLLHSRLSQVIEFRETIKFDFILNHAVSGCPLYLQVCIQPEYDMDNKICGIIIISHDITSLKHKENELLIEKERAEESSKLKSFFLAIISHEIRTPLNAIIGLSQLLKDETLGNEDRDEFIDLIEESGMKLIHNVENTLELSKIASGQLVIKFEMFHPNVIIKNQYLEAFKISGVNKKECIEFKVKYLEGAYNYLSLNSDAKLIKHVLEILISNAFKYTEKGYIELGVNILMPDMVTFYVQDTGIGIAEEKHESIFEPFVQVDISMIRSYEGMGIGLTLARRIARALGGNLTLDSTPGKGSTFLFSLPLIPKDQY